MDDKGNVIIYLNLHQGYLTLLDRNEVSVMQNRGLHLCVCLGFSIVFSNIMGMEKSSCFCTECVNLYIQYSNYVVNTMHHSLYVSHPVLISSALKKLKGFIDQMQFNKITKINGVFK